MFKAPCPSCGGELIFQSKSSILSVCTYCRSNVVRHDTNLELLGKQADLMEDMSPLQIGVTGKYKNKTFHILGRQILRWKDGQWNEWYIMFSDGSDGWIAEAQGEFSVLLKAKNPPKPPIEDLKTVKIDGVTYKRVDKKKVSCLGSEGELPFKTVEGSTSIVFDFTDAKEGFASIELTSTGEALTYVGSFTNLHKMKVVGIRRFEGWENL